MKKPAPVYPESQTEVRLGMQCKLTRPGLKGKWATLVNISESRSLLRFWLLVGGPDRFQIFEWHLYLIGNKLYDVFHGGGEVMTVEWR